jgi:hypothetical protein
VAQHLTGPSKNWYSQPPIVSTRTSSALQIGRAIQQASRMAVYVGIPATSDAERISQLLALAGKITSKSKRSSKRRDRIRKLASDTKVNNAELLYIHSKGSPLRKIPARPVLEPAIAASGNREAIAAELAAALKAAIEQNTVEAVRRMKRAGVAGQNAARGWFTDSRNNWQANAPSTIRQKGSERPLIDTGAMRQAITYVLDVTSLKDIKKEKEEERKKKKEQPVKEEKPDTKPLGKLSEQPVGLVENAAGIAAQQAGEAVQGTGEVFGEAAEGIGAAVEGAIATVEGALGALGEGALGLLAL